VVLVYDSSRPETFDDVPQWLARVRTHGNPKAVILCATKYDISVGQALHVGARKYAASAGIPWMSTSAHTDSGVAEVFRRVVADARSGDTQLLAVPRPKALLKSPQQDAGAIHDATTQSLCPRAHHLYSSCFAHPSRIQKARAKSRHETAEAALQVFDDDDAAESSLSLPQTAHRSNEQVVISPTGDPKRAAPSCAHQGRV